MVEQLHYRIGESSLGLVLVAWSERGVCAVLLGDDRTALGRDLAIRFPSCTIVRQDSDDAADTAADTAADRTMREVIDAVERPARPGPSAGGVRVDMRGSAFQQAVWRALREIPRGATATYTDVAVRIGKPLAVRAVAQACGANPLAVLVPCHRVLRRDGGLSGYRWGVERKRSLLERERMR